MRAALFDKSTRYFAWSCWQCGASAVTSTPSSSMLSRSVENMGISFVLTSTLSCPRTIPLVCVNAASRCRHRPLTVAEPGKDLPSTAITRISFGFTARSAVQAPRMRSRPLASILFDGASGCGFAWHLTGDAEFRQHRWTGRGGPFGDGHERARPGDDGARCDRQDPHQSVPQSPGFAWIGHRVQRGQQGRRRFRYVGGTRPRRIGQRWCTWAMMTSGMALRDAQMA